MFLDRFKKGSLIRKGEIKRRVFLRILLFPFSTDYFDGTENNKTTLYMSAVKPVISSPVGGRGLPRLFKAHSSA